MENKTIEALEKLVSLKDETIKELERQIQLLKNPPDVNLNVPYVSTQPYQPSQPLVGTVPHNPLQPYGTSGAIISDGTNSNWAITTDGNSTYTLINTDGSANVINLKECSRA